MPNKTVRRNKSLRRTKRRTNGGGWSDFLPTSAVGTTGDFKGIAVAPGYQIHWPFSGVGKDCTGNPMSIRPGHIFDYTPKGLPGMRGGKRNKKAWKKRGGGGLQTAAAQQAENVNPLPASMKAQLNQETNKPPTVSAPGVPTHTAQAGGRYGFFPGMGPLNPVNGVGVAPAPFGRIPCEIGTYNPLNPNPNDIQRLSTAPLVPPFVTKPFSGGGAVSVPAGTNLSASGGNFPVVKVGDVDSMRYYAPTAGYRNDFMTFRAPSPVPGLAIPTPYDARAFNQACVKTGGSRKNKKKGGAAEGPFASEPAPFSPVQMDQIWTRKDFDGSNNLLPCKFGGKRNKTRRGVKKHKKSKKQKKQKKN